MFVLSMLFFLFQQPLAAVVASWMLKDVVETMNNNTAG